MPLACSEDSEEEIDTTLLLDSKKLDRIENQDSKDYMTNPYMLNTDEKPYIIELIQKSLTLTKYRVIVFGVVTLMWKVLLITGIVLFVMHKDQCSSASSWSKFTLCVLGYMLSSYLGIFIIQLGVWIQGKKRMITTQKNSVKIPEIVSKTMTNESLVDILCIGNRIKDIIDRRKLIKNIIMNDTNAKNEFNQLSISNSKYQMTKAIKDAIRISESTIGQITVPNKREFQCDGLVNKFFVIWIGIPILTILMWICVAVDYKPDAFIHKQFTLGTFYKQNITNPLYIFIKTKQDCDSLYIFNIIMMILVSVQTVISFIPYFLRLMWNYKSWRVN